MRVNSIYYDCNYTLVLLVLDTFRVSTKSLKIVFGYSGGCLKPRTNARRMSARIARRHFSKSNIVAIGLGNVFNGGA